MCQKLKKKKKKIPLNLFMNSKSITDRVFLNLIEKILFFNIPQITQYILPQLALDPSIYTK